MHDYPVMLRPLTDDDLPLIDLWLHDPRVAEWWSDDPVGEVEDIKSELSSNSTVYRIVEVEDRAVGLLFRYRIDDHIDYVHELAAARVNLPPDAWSMDYLIGDSTVVGRGLGSAMIRAACEELWSSEATASCVLVPVHADNSRSWRALQRAGFARIPGIFEMEPDTAAHDGRHVVYMLRRPAPDREPGHGRSHRRIAAHQRSDS